MVAHCNDILPEQPTLVRVESNGLAWWADPILHSEGVVIAFSERAGGSSLSPYESLNLASHVGDEPRIVDENRERFLDALGLSPLRGRLTTAEQVHGSRVQVVGEQESGAGAFALADPIRSCDALITSAQNVPLMMFYADCVPVVLVAPGPVVAVLHAGWRGALASLPGTAAENLSAVASCSASSIRAYIGAHIRSCHYDVSADILSQFVNSFGTLSRAESGGLDLDHAVSESLTRSGVDECRIARLGICTAEATDRFFSYRAEAGMTGRHAALVCISR